MLCHWNVLIYGPATGQVGTRCKSERLAGVLAGPAGGRRAGVAAAPVRAAAARVPRAPRTPRARVPAAARQGVAPFRRLHPRTPSHGLAFHHKWPLPRSFRLRFSRIHRHTKHCVGKAPLETCRAQSAVTGLFRVERVHMNVLCTITLPNVFLHAESQFVNVTVAQCVT
jgi:hypothetical protein